VTDPLASLRRLIRGPADAVRWACVLEATSPKAGNVYPGQPFDDLCHVDFIQAAEIAAETLTAPDRPIGRRMLAAVERTFQTTGTNVNLGMILLLGPLVAADEKRTSLHVDRDTQPWLTEVDRVLASLTKEDGTAVFTAIRSSQAGGLQTVDQLDVHQTDQPVDLIEAMRLAADRDRIARQYATGFRDLLYEVVPVLWQTIRDCGDVLGGTAAAHVELLRREPDSLIARKNGTAVAASIQRHAQKVDLDDPNSLRSFDDSLRSQSHQLNPGTTADLIAAAFYVILRTPNL